MSSTSAPTSLYAPTKNLRRIGLAPFVALLFAYCAGGPFSLESMVSTSGPGLGLTFLLVVPLLFSVPIALATAEMTTLMPVEGGFYRWTRGALGDSLPCHMPCRLPQSPVQVSDGLRFSP